MFCQGTKPLFHAILALMEKPILLVTADSTRTGAPRQVALLARGLADTGVPVAVACPSGWLPQTLEHTGVGIHLLEDTHALHVQLGRIREIIAMTEPRIVHTHGVRGGLWGRLAANPNDLNVIYTEHLWTSDFHLANPYRERLQLASLQWLDRRTHRTVAVSDAVQRFLIAKHITTPEKLRVIAGAVEAHPEIKLTKESVIGTLGTLTKVKGIDVLLEALVHLSGVRLIVGGDGPERVPLEKMAARLGVADRVTWMSHTDNPAEFYASIRTYVQPSRSESFGLAPLEAMSRGIPVVLSDRGALPELITPGREGVITALAPAGLAAGIAETLEHAETYRDAARVRAQAFSPEQLVTAHQALYTSL